jgi:hypothetical protein
LGALSHNWTSLDTNASIAGILQRVCTHDWFFEEFSGASGFTWLEGMFSKLEAEVAAIIYQSLMNVTSEEDTLAWISCIYRCLAQRQPNDGPRTSHRCAKRLAPSRNHTITLRSALMNIYEEQQRHRAENYDCPLAPNGFETLYEAQRSTPNGGANRHAYVRGWPDARWQRWQGTVEELLLGLRRGFILLGPSHSSLHFSRDPDGFCARLWPFAPQGEQGNGRRVRERLTGSVGHQWE